MTVTHAIPDLLRGFAQSLAKEQPNEEALVRAAAKSCQQLLGAQQSSVWLVNSRGNRLVLRAAEGYGSLKAEDVGSLEYQLDGQDDRCIGITAWIFLNKQAVSADSYPELKQKPGYRGFFDRELHGVTTADSLPDHKHPCQQFYGGPIYLGEDKFGVLKVENKRLDIDGSNCFSEREKEDLDAVAAMLAMALKHARAGREAEMRLQEYHMFTLHSIRNELPPLHLAEDFLKELAIQFPGNEQIKSASRFLELGLQGLTFYLDNHLMFLRREITEDTITRVPIWQLIQDEANLLREVSQDDLEINTFGDDFKEQDIDANRPFLSAAMKELLRNARKAIFRRREREKVFAAAQRKGIELVGKGLVTIHLSDQPGDDRVRNPHLVITVSDNGDATTDQRARASLNEAWSRVSGEYGQVVSRGQARRGVQIGLEFIQSVITGHQGYIELSDTSDVTSFQIHFPYRFNAKVGG